MPLKHAAPAKSPSAKKAFGSAMVVSRSWEHQIRDDLDLQRHVDYIHMIPVKHGLVTQVRDWPHSSFHRYVKEGKLPADWGGMDNGFTVPE